MPDPLVYVVMPVLNQYAVTRRALDSLLRMTYSNFKIIVVNNGSSDETAECLPRDYSNVNVLSLSNNVGFAAGVNWGIKQALADEADYIFVINNDTEVASDILSKLLPVMQPNVGATAPIIYDMDTPEIIWSAGFSKGRLLPLMKQGLRGQMDTGDLVEPFEVDYLLGCAVLLNARALLDVGLYDERYFFYYEDLDLSHRLSEHGYRLLTVPSAKVWHEGSKTAGPATPFRVYHMARSSVIFFLSNTTGIQKLASILFWLGSSIKKSCRFIRKKQYNNFRSHWHGIWDGLHTQTGGLL